MESKDYVGPYLNAGSLVKVSLVSEDSRLLRVCFSLSDKLNWTVYRTPYEVWKMHVYFSLRHMGDLLARTDGGSVPRVSWFHVEHRGLVFVSEQDCEDIEKFLMWILGNPPARSSETFGQFSQVSPLSFHNGEKSLVEGYAHKRRGGRRFTMQGCSGTLSGGIASLFRKKFQKRWFILRRDYIVYTDSRTSVTVRDVFLFDRYFNIRLVSEKEGGRGTIKPPFFRSSKIENSQYLEIQNGYRKLILQFDSHMEANQWFKTIENAYTRSEWMNQRANPFDSFAPMRDHCHVKFLIDGENYMRELDKELRCAKNEIYISGWWLVPELPLVRPTQVSADHSLLSILRERAEEYGVKVYIVLYKELSVALSLDSHQTKNVLEAISPNIRVIRHPKQIGINAVLAWSHHQKLIVIDHRVAFIGGLDLCLGRFDNPQHRLVDVEPPYMFPGKDYCNPCLRDMVDVTNPLGAQNLYDRASEPRLPWHDVHCLVRGEVVNDIVRHFVQLWNHVKTDKHKRESDVEYLVQESRRVSNVIDDEAMATKSSRFGRSSSSQMTIMFGDEEPIHLPAVPPAHYDALGLGVGASLGVSGDQAVETPVRWKERIRGYFRRKSDGEEVEDVPLPERLADQLSPRASASMASAKVQFLRSGAWWSVGLPTEHSILNAYCSLIRQAKEYVYIENQFFVTCAKFDVGDEWLTRLDSGVVRNLIGRFIAERIARAEEMGEEFKLYIVLPIMPAFENSQLMDPSGFVTRATLQLQFQALTRGEDSIMGFIRKALPELDANTVFHKHVCVCGLRQVDTWPNGEIRTEQLYVHSKAMIVDDRFAVIGSANINDRSMLGDRDSEIAVLIEDSAFARSLRIELWKEHSGSTDENLLADPSSARCFTFWKETSRQNAEIYNRVFGAIPSNNLKNRQAFIEHMKKVQSNSVHTKADTEKHAQLQELKGRLVEFQLEFLQEENDLYTPMPTTASLCPREVFS